MNKKPEVKKEKPSMNPPTTNSSLKKLTILFEDGLSKPNKLKPKVFIMENVKGIISMLHDKSKLNKDAETVPIT